MAAALEDETPLLAVEVASDVSVVVAVTVPGLSLVLVLPANLFLKPVNPEEDSVVTTGEDCLKVSEEMDDDSRVGSAVSKLVLWLSSNFCGEFVDSSSPESDPLVEDS